MWGGILAPRKLYLEKKGNLIVMYRFSYRFSNAPNCLSFWPVQEKWGARDSNPRAPLPGRFCIIPHPGGRAGTEAVLMLPLLPYTPAVTICLGWGVVSDVPSFLPSFLRKRRFWRVFLVSWCSGRRGVSYCRRGNTYPWYFFWYFCLKELYLIYALPLTLFLR